MTVERVIGLWKNLLAALVTFAIMVLGLSMGFIVDWHVASMNTLVTVVTATMMLVAFASPSLFFERLFPALGFAFIAVSMFSFLDVYGYVNINKLEPIVSGVVIAVFLIGVYLAYAIPRQVEETIQIIENI